MGIAGRLVGEGVKRGMILHGRRLAWYDTLFLSIQRGCISMSSSAEFDRVQIDFSCR